MSLYKLLFKMYLDEIETKKSGNWPKHPTSHWREWKSWKFENKKKTIEWWFSYYDKTVVNPDGLTWADVFVPLSQFPQEFVVVAEKYSVWWWDNNKDKGVWWPEIDDFFGDYTAISDWSVCWKWKYNEVPEGMWIWRNLHVFDPKNPDELFTIKLKNTQSTEWFGTFSKDENRGAYIWKRIKFWKEKEMKHWSKQWTIPTYEVGEDLTEEDRINRRKFADILREYHLQADQSSEEEPSIADAIIEKNVTEYTDDNLPF